MMMMTIKMADVAIAGRNVAHRKNRVSPMPENPGAAGSLNGLEKSCVGMGSGAFAGMDEVRPDS